MFGFGVMNSATERVIILPHWIPISVAAVFGVLPLLDYRFSLRTLLIVTTLTALMLGLVATLRR
jgi:hypothetical protein